MSLKIVFILANSASPDEMTPYASFHPGLHCLHNKYLFVGMQNEGQSPKKKPKRKLIRNVYALST